MRVYNSIPDDIKPSAAAAKLNYAKAFDNDFAFSLRERKSASLTAMFIDALEVEENMMASGKMKQRDIDRRKIREENMPSTSSFATDIKFEMILKTMEKLMDIFTMDNRSFNREQADPQIRTPNFRRPNPPMPPQNRQRNMRNLRNQEEQQIRPPFPENYVADEEDPAENEIHLSGELDSEIYLIEEEHHMFAHEGGNEVLKGNQSSMRGVIYMLWMMYKDRSD